MRLRKTLLTAVAVVAISGAANAAFIAAGSQYNIAGFDRAQPDNGLTTLDMATGLDFTAGSGPTPGTPGVLSGANGNGTFAALGSCSGSCGSITDILSFSAFAGQTGEFVTTSGVSFDLNAPLSITRIAANPAAGQLATLIIAGLGTFHLAGYDATPANFTLTTQGNAVTTFSASATGTALNVPEPMSLALLGTSLAGLGFLRRFRRS